MKVKQSIQFLMLVAAMFVAVGHTMTHAVQIQDIVRLKGSESTKLVGYGLVVGLNGTGDGGKFNPTARALAQQIAHLSDETVSAAELVASKNTAIVSISAMIPRTGVREGDMIDVHVASVGPAKSLAGGRLSFSQLIVPKPYGDVFAVAEGAIRVNESSPTTGIVHSGAQLTGNVMTRYLDEFGQMTLVVNDQHAGWQVANMLASTINQTISPDGPKVAKAINEKNVVILVPEYVRENPSQFISDILVTYVDPVFVKSGSRVRINMDSQTIVIDGNVQFSPAGVIQKGLTITTIEPEPVPSKFNPITKTRDVAAIDPDKRGGARLASLLEAFEQLKISAKDKIEIIRMMHANGNIHAQLIIE
ncbi:flagellar basal body P-ring protein FlgI [Poriferisphaera sp. WC338]|uniref:flagellar basal body P-ring protein FlgI n=1 Tax=Poriferisphaera sp. WC338 TaxID=3425129 RepID=UPI003D81B785